MIAGIDVRVADREELDGLCHVARVTWRATYAGILPDEDIEAFLDRYYQPDQLVALRQRYRQTFLIAVDGDEVVGYATSGIDRQSRPVLFALYVLPDRQGQGIGMRLWAELHARFREAGYTKFYLWVHEGNMPAREFYERRGAIQGEVAEFPVGSGMAREVMYTVPVESAAPSPGPTPGQSPETA